MERKGITYHPGHLCIQCILYFANLIEEEISNGFARRTVLLISSCIVLIDSV